MALLALLPLALAGCGEAGESPGPAGRAGPGAVLEATRAYQQAFLDHDAEAACAMYTGAAKRDLVAELRVSADCGETLGALFDLMGPEDEARVRRALREVDADDVKVDGKAARVALPSGGALHLAAVGGRWYVSRTSAR